jgi:hypothetical protein
MKKLLLIPCLFSLVLLTGCVTKPVNLTPAFWQQHDTPVAIVVTESPKEGSYVMMGSQGLLDMAVAAAVTTEVRAATHKVDASAFNEVAKEFETELTKAGFKPAIFTSNINLENLPKREDSDSDGFESDLSSIANPTGARYVLVLELVNYGALRTYYAFVPTSAPSGFAAVRGRLVDVTNKNAVVWDTGDQYPQNTVQEPIAGEWKQSPDYPNLVAAINRAILSSRQLLVDRFFESKP